MNILNNIDLLLNNKDKLEELINNITIKLNPIRPTIFGIKKNKEQVKEQLNKQLEKLCNESIESKNEQDVSIRSGKLKSILATLSSNIKNDKLVYHNANEKKNISFKDLFDISDQNYKLLIDTVDLTKMDVPRINLLETTIDNICNFLLKNIPLNIISQEIKTEQLHNKQPKHKELTTYEYTIYIDKDGKFKCGNTYKPKQGQVTFKTLQDCIKPENLYNINNIYFKNQQNKDLLIEFWNGRNRPQINGKDVAINIYADHYINKLVQTDENKVDNESATRLINHYKNNYKYVIYESKGGKKGCTVNLPKAGQASFNTFKDCLSYLRSQK